jgi:hypothetical protein
MAHPVVATLVKEIGHFLLPGRNDVAPPYTRFSRPLIAGFSTLNRSTLVFIASLHDFPIKIRFFIYLLII